VTSGSITPDASGNFTAQLTTSGFGDIAAVALSGDGGASDLRFSGYQNLPPTIESQYQILPAKRLRVFGVVHDENPAACTVTITGVAGGTVHPSSTGAWDVVLSQSAPGIIYVSAYD